MKNAHERFGRLAYQRRSEKTATNIRVLLDAFVGEEHGKAHLVSVIGGDVELGALNAAFANGDSFAVVDPSGFERKSNSDRQRSLVHLVFAGAALRTARYAGVGTLDNLAIASAEAYPGSAELRIFRSGGEGDTKGTAGAAAPRAAHEEPEVSGI